MAGATPDELGKLIPGYFTIAEVKDLGDENTFTITFSGMKKVGQTQEEKAVLEFAETRKALVLGARRVAALRSLFGPGGNIVGEQISIGVDVVKGREEIVIMAPSSDM